MVLISEQCVGHVSASAVVEDMGMMIIILVLNGRGTVVTMEGIIHNSDSIIHQQNHKQIVTDILSYSHKLVVLGAGAVGKRTN